MKRLSTQQLVEVLAASQLDVDNAAQLLGRKFSEMQNGWIQDGLAKGHYQAAKMQVDGVDRFLVVYHINDQRALFINAAAQLSPGSNFAAFHAGLVNMAQNLKCKAIEGITLRAGMMKSLLDHGWKPVGVTLSLSL